ncbi:hypothetical protein LTS16_002039 [Friedmanniomyces endolithicus]|nr:hypothetical protein LTS09_007163 [Friedmanniomyces endolithicus]KAK0281763.1 hypothetical protein LTR35_007444 [Friedmanniomyces endolithicus]KAK0315616.1 hypothetical protein LTR01_000916 [Friedmanniomyces endolithicus]KAK0835975.1 hypothetical protein LTR73_000476 [Friedmanniomyces endolithicus]KAK1008401.1 hypothetical protein LTR54_006194 [Friedmanniomyces endolithicus]
MNGDETGTNHVWITRDKIARDLLTKRSAIYSDRPFIPALEQDDRTSGQYLPLMSRNEKWVRQRKFAKQTMDTSENASFYGYPELKSVRLLFELMTEPSKYNVAMESFIARVTSRLAWGTPTPSDELKQRARELLIGVSPGGALGNKLPFLMSLPERLAAPKAWEARRSRTERKFFETMQAEVQQDVDSKRKATSSKIPRPIASRPKQSWMRMFLERKKSWGFRSDLEGAFAVGMHGIAGALTIAAPMQSFCLALCHYPQYQPILHEEIDRVLGDRMPTFDHMEEMPVLRAFIRETLRWRPPVPTGIPHELIQDDMYEGYHIPAGSVIHPLEWSISRDPQVFLEPDQWNPMRWLEAKYPTYQEPLSKYPTITQYSQFGYGRRTCQGMAVTEADLFVGLGSVAWLFSMAKPEIEDASAEVDTDVKADITPRDEPTLHDEVKSCGEGTRNLSRYSKAFTSLSADERSFFEQNAERIKRQSRRYSGMPVDLSAMETETLPQMIPSQVDNEDSPVRDLIATFENGLPTPPTSPDGGDTRHKPSASALKLAMGRMTMQRNDSAISLPRGFPGLTTDPAAALPSPPLSPVDETSSTSSPLRSPRSTMSPKIDQPCSLPQKTPLTSVDDPTMNFSTLLTAKPLHFDFNLCIRNQARAELVARRWVELKMQGEFEASRVFWGGGKDTKGDAELGWGEVFA